MEKTKNNKTKPFYETYNPDNGKIFNVIDDDGKVVNSNWSGDIDDKIILKALKENIEKFEARFGEIKIDTPNQHFGFVPPKDNEKVN